MITAVGAGMAAARIADGTGTAVKPGTGHGMTVAVGMVMWAGMTMAGISVGTSTDGPVLGGAALSPRPMAGVGRALSAPVWAGGTGGSPGAGAASTGDGAPNHGPGAACWLVPRSAWWSPLP